MKKFLSNIFSKDFATKSKINKGRKNPSFSRAFLEKNSSDAKISNGFESHPDETFLDVDASFTDEHFSKRVSEDNVGEVVVDDNFAELNSESTPRDEIEADITSLKLKTGSLKGDLESIPNNNLSKEPEEAVSSNEGPFTNDSSDWEREEWIELISRDKFPMDVYEKSFDAQEVDGEGNTLLHYSAYFGSTDYTLQLLDAGWDLHSKNIKKKTVFDYATEAGNTHLLRKLNELVDKLNSQNEAKYKNDFSEKISVETPFFKRLRNANPDADSLNSESPSEKENNITSSFLDEYKEPTSTLNTNTLIGDISTLDTEKGLSTENFEDNLEYPKSLEDRPDLLDDTTNKPDELGKQNNFDGISRPSVDKTSYLSDLSSTIFTPKRVHEKKITGADNPVSDLNDWEIFLDEELEEGTHYNDEYFYDEDPLENYRTLETYSQRLVNSLSEYNQSKKKHLFGFFQEILQSFPYYQSYAAIERLILQGNQIDRLSDTYQIKLLWSENPSIWSERYFSRMENSWNVTRNPKIKNSMSWQMACDLARNYPTSELENLILVDWYDEWLDLSIENANTVSGWEPGYNIYASYLHQKRFTNPFSLKAK